MWEALLFLSFAYLIVYACVVTWDSLMYYIDEGPDRSRRARVCVRFAVCRYLRGALPAVGIILMVVFVSIPDYSSVQADNSRPFALRPDIAVRPVCEEFRDHMPITRDERNRAAYRLEAALAAEEPGSEWPYELPDYPALRAACEFSLLPGARLMLQGLQEYDSALYREGWQLADDWFRLYDALTAEDQTARPDIDRPFSATD